MFYPVTQVKHKGVVVNHSFPWPLISSSLESSVGSVFKMYTNLSSFLHPHCNNSNPNYPFVLLGLTCIGHKLVCFLKFFSKMLLIFPVVLLSFHFLGILPELSELHVV